MEIKQLDEPQAQRIYRRQMTRDFPESELKPFSRIAQMMAQGSCRFFGLMDGEDAAAYAALVCARGPKPALLLDYYAVEESRRGQGLGGSFLKELQGLARDTGAPWLLIEAESLESAETAAQKEQRQRRFRFYEHCGCQSTGVYSRLFGVEYRILCLPLGDEPSEDLSVKASLEQAYRVIFPWLQTQGETAGRENCQVYLGPAKR